MYLIKKADITELKLIQLLTATDINEQINLLTIQGKVTLNNDCKHIKFHDRLLVIICMRVMVV